MRLAESKQDLLHVVRSNALKRKCDKSEADLGVSIYRNIDIAVRHSKWNSLKNYCDGVRFLVNLYVTLSNFQPQLRKLVYSITALINAEQLL